MVSGIRGFRQKPAFDLCDRLLIPVILNPGVNDSGHLCSEPALRYKVLNYRDLAVNDLFNVTCNQ